MMKPHRLNIRVTTAMLRQLEREAHGHGVTMTAIMETALQRYFDTEDIEPLDSRVIRRLDRLELCQAAIERDVAIGLETLQHYIFYWLTRAEPIPEGERDAAHALGQRRFDYFIEQVARKIDTG
ncbi:MAG: hypothetical protein V7741_01525 [Hyphomonas sp.]